MKTRRTSLYQLRVPSAFPHEVLPALRDKMIRRERPVHDQHSVREDGVTYAVIGYRAAGDTDAILIARSLELLPPYSIVTGYGVHRRTVL